MLFLLPTGIVDEFIHIAFGTQQDQDVSFVDHIVGSGHIVEAVFDHVLALFCDGEILEFNGNHIDTPIEW